MDGRRWLRFIAELVQDSAYSPPRGETPLKNNSPRQNRRLLFLGFGEYELAEFLDEILSESCPSVPEEIS